MLIPYNTWIYLFFFLIWVSLALIRVQPLTSWETEFRLCIMYLQYSAWSVQVCLPHGLIMCPGLLPGVVLHFLSVSFPSVCVFIYPVCSNFKLLTCTGFLFHSLPVVLNEIINRWWGYQSWNVVVIYWSGVMKSFSAWRVSGFLPVWTLEATVFLLPLWVSFSWNS